MSDRIQIVVKVNVPPDQRNTFLEKIEELVAQCEANEPRTVGIEWFLNDSNEAIVVDTYEDSAAFLTHVANVGKIAQIISQMAPTSETLVLGSPTAPVQEMLASMGAKFFLAAAGFNRTA